jgi:hypothetical protein
MQCSRTIASFGNVQGHSHGMERFTRPYSIELTPEQYFLLCEEECMKLERVEIKFVDPLNTLQLKFIPFYVCAKERAERVRIDEENKKAEAERTAAEAAQRQQYLIALAQGPKKVGRDSWCFIKSYDPYRDDLFILLFGQYQVFLEGSNFRFVLKQTWDGQTQTFQDFEQGKDGIVNDVFLHQDLVSVGYGDFANLTPDKIQEE